MQQLIKEPTHNLRYSSSYIDLIFTSHESLVMELGVHPFLHLTCHHQIRYAKFSLKIHYPPPYKRETRNYQKVTLKYLIDRGSRNKRGI